MSQRSLQIVSAFFDEGKIVRIQSYPSFDETLEALLRKPGGFESLRPAPI